MENLFKKDIVSGSRFGIYSIILFIIGTPLVVPAPESVSLYFVFFVLVLSVIGLIIHKGHEYLDYIVPSIVAFCFLTDVIDSIAMLPLFVLGIVALLYFTLRDASVKKIKYFCLMLALLSPWVLAMSFWISFTEAISYM